MDERTSEDKTSLIQSKGATVDEGTQTSLPNSLPLYPKLSTKTRLTGAFVNNAFAALVNTLQTRLSDKSLGWPSAFFIMISMSYGSAVMIMPFTMRQLGVVIWTLFTSCCILILAFCNVMLKEACVEKLTKIKDKSSSEYLAIIQQPYQKVAEIAVNQRFAKLIQVTLYICLACQVLGFMLLAATSLNQAVPLTMIEYNRIRTWLVICYIIAMPFFFIGTYTDLVTPAFIAVCSSIVASICIFVVSFVTKYHYGQKTYKYEVSTTGSNRHIFKMFGEIVFAGAGPAVLIPNIVVLMKKPNTFHVPILICHLIVFLIFALLALIPYMIFGLNVRSNIIDTLHDMISKLDMSSIWLSVLTMTEVILALHLAMVAVLSANPVMLSMEHKLKIPTAFTYKRVLLRASLITILLIISLCIPFFEPVISIIGAVPQSLLCVIYPIIIYWHSFKTSIRMKVLLSLVLVGTVIFMVGSVFFSIYDIVVYFWPTSVEGL